MKSFADILGRAKETAAKVGSVFWHAKQQQQARGFMSALSDLIRSAGYQGAAESVGRLERGSMPPQTDEQRAMRALLDRASGQLTTADVKDILNRISSILAQSRSKPTYTTEAKQQMVGLAQITSEIIKQLDAAKQAEELLSLGISSPSYMVSKEYPIDTQFGYRSKLLETEAEEGVIPMLTPGSSNVYSFWWIPDKQNPAKKAKDGGTLYVTFKSWYKGQKGRPDEPGSTYAYSNVSRDRFKEFTDHTNPNTAGWAVWEYLRVRGTRSGHQHPYRLTQGQAKDPDRTHGGVYIPRMATAKGFATRTFASPKGWKKSRMAPQQGMPEPVRSHATWRSMSNEQKAEVVRSFKKGFGR